MSTAGPETLISQAEAAALLGIPRRVLHVFIRRNGIVPKPMPSNALARGLDAEDVDVLRAAWEATKVGGPTPR